MYVYFSCFISFFLVRLISSSWMSVIVFYPNKVHTRFPNLCHLIVRQLFWRQATVPQNTAQNFINHLNFSASEARDKKLRFFR